MDREVCHIVVGSEADIGSQVADSVGPGAVGQTPLPKCAALRLKPPPAETEYTICEVDEN